MPTCWPPSAAGGLPRTDAHKPIRGLYHTPTEKKNRAAKLREYTMALPVPMRPKNAQTQVGSLTGGKREENLTRQSAPAQPTSPASSPKRAFPGRHAFPSPRTLLHPEHRWGAAASALLPVLQLPGWAACQHEQPSRASSCLRLQLRPTGWPGTPERSSGAAQPGCCRSKAKGERKQVSTNFPVLLDSLPVCVKL